MAGAVAGIRRLDSSISSSSHSIKDTARQHRPEMQEPKVVPGVSVCGSIRRMDSSITSSSHSIMDAAKQHRADRVRGYFLGRAFRCYSWPEVRPLLGWPLSASLFVAK